MVRVRGEGDRAGGAPLPTQGGSFWGWIRIHGMGWGVFNRFFRRYGMELRGLGGEKGSSVNVFY